MNKQQNLRKLWRDIGLTKQKYDRDSSRSPSFDRSSLGKSKQIKSNSSQDISISRKQHRKTIQQIKPKQCVKFSKFCEKIDKLGIDIKSIPEEDDFQTVYNSGFCKKQQNRQKYQACENPSEMQLLSFIFKKPKPISKIYKDQLQMIKQKMRKIKINYNQIQRLINYQFTQYRKDLQKNDQVIKGLLDELARQSQKRKDKSMQLLEQNHKLRSQLIYAYRLIQDFQKHRSQNQKSLLSMNLKQQQYYQHKQSDKKQQYYQHKQSDKKQQYYQHKQSDKKTVKRDEHRKNKKTYSILHLPNSNETMEFVPQNNENRNSQKHFVCEKFNQSHIQRKEKQSYTNREKLKKYIEEKKKKNDKNLEEFEVKTENLQSPNLIKFSKIVKLSANENPFLNLGNSPNLYNLTEQRFYKKIAPQSQIFNDQFTKNIKDIAKNLKNSKKK